MTIVEPGAGRWRPRASRASGAWPSRPQLLAACEAALGGAARTSSPGNGASAHRGAADGASDTAIGAGLRVLVTAGGTREPIDSVRFVGNSSSGRMGLALAEAALARGAEVTLVAANVALAASAAIARRDVVTAERAAARVRARVPRRRRAADGRRRRRLPPGRRARGQDQEGRSRAAWSCELEATADVLAALSAQRRDRPDARRLRRRARRATPSSWRGASCSEKGLDAIVVNDISRTDIGFDADANEVTILTADGSPDGAIEVARASKAQVAEAILDAVESLRGAQ